MNTEEAFVQAILTEHDDDAHRLIFADWLLERNDPREPVVRRQGLLGPSLRVGAADARRAWAGIRPTPSACSICTAMSGSGARIGTAFGARTRWSIRARGSQAAPPGAMRGGSWCNAAWDCRSALRRCGGASWSRYQDGNTGFRVALMNPGPEPGEPLSFAQRVAPVK